MVEGMKQQELGLHYGITIPPIDGHTNLKEMVDRLNNDILQIPDFHRDPCWEQRKITEWCETVISQQAIGTLVTYQIKGKGPQYLADGLQRLTATKYFMRNPQAYGFAFGPGRAQEFCSAFLIPVQHRHYDTHEKAMEAFQNLNKGTVTTPAEFHKGELTLDPVGKYLYDKIPNIVEQVSYSMTFNQAGGRETIARLRRNALVLFWQYVSGTPTVSYCRVNQIQTDGTSIESKLMAYIESEKWTEFDAGKHLKSFERFLQSSFAMIEDLLVKQGQNEKAFSKTLLRALFHLAIWRKNTGRPVNKHVVFLTKFFEHLERYPSMTSCSEIIGEDGNTRSVQVGLNTISRFKVFDEIFDVGFFDKPITRAKGNTRPGYDRSHVLPFVDCGEGEVIIEPASLNRARGASPIE